MPIQTRNYFPPHRVVESRPCVDVFALAREGLLAPGASAALQIGLRGYPLAAHEGWISIGGQRVAVVSHTHLPLRMFLCGCGRGAYCLYEVGGVWRCRSCPPPLDYACRHQGRRSFAGLALIRQLRRRLGVEAKPFAPLPYFPAYYRRKRRIAAEIMRLEARLLCDLRYQDRRSHI